VSVGFWERFLPPPGAPEAVRVGAHTWREVATALQDVGDAAWLRSSTLTSGWWGPAKEAFVTEVGGFFHALDEATGLMQEYAGALDGQADGIE
jgi:hypothetical protein